MRIATLQFASKLAQRDINISRANELITDMIADSIDLLVLPEMAFSGYNFPDLLSIEPFLEPTASGVSTEWARITAARLHCHVCVGYPEHTIEDLPEQRKNYNAQVIVSPAGNVVAHYRKSFLYYTDETWASEGQGFAQTIVPAFGELERVVMGICMDINPYKFQSAWDKYEFARFGREAGVRLVVLSTAWLTTLMPEEMTSAADVPDLDTLNYWVNRFTPLLHEEVEEEVVVIFANRCGFEPGQVMGVTRGTDAMGRDVVGYAGTSCVMGFCKGRLRVWDIMGRASEGVLRVDTNAQARLENAASASTANPE